MAILDHTGKWSSFLSPEMQSYPSAHGEGVMLSSSEVHPSPALPKMQCFPSPQILSHIRVGKDSCPFKCKTPTNPSQQLLFFIIFVLFLFIYLFYFFFYFSFFLVLFEILFLSFFPNTWNSSPKWNYSPVFEANNRRIDAPVLMIFFLGGETYFPICYALMLTDIALWNKILE